MCIKDELSKFKQKINAIHKRKLLNVGISNELNPCNPNDVIKNLSSKTIPKRITFLLAFGLDFSLPPFGKIHFERYMLPFEKLALSLSKLSSISNVNFDRIKESLKFIAYKYYYGFKSNKIVSPIFSEKDIKLLKEFSKDESIIVCKPDKGRGIVILDRTEYEQKMHDLLQDSTKFKSITDDVSKIIFRQEDSINNFLRNLKKKGIIEDNLYRDLFVSGCCSGILYGLPKTHKIGNPLRPIFSALNTPSFNLCKFFVPILEPLTKSQYTLKNSYEFANCINESKFNNCTIASFDIESLFTNIPVDETIDIILESFFENNNTFMNFSRDQFKKLLSLAVKNSIFMFSGKLYEQLDGLGMGLPLGPTFANIFLCKWEKIWLDKCPKEFKPLLYKRYLDDTFLVFRSPDHIDKFKSYLNCRHKNIKFTSEIEINNKLSFLDINVHKLANGFQTSVFRKKTFTGLGISFFSFDLLKFKRNAIKTLLFRAYRISSNYQILHEEIEFLKHFFIKNGFPIKMIYNEIKIFFNNLYDKKVISTVPKLCLFAKMPYLGKHSEKLKFELSQLLNSKYPFVECNFIFVNNRKIKNFFHHKERQPTHMRSMIIYNYCCAQCSASYVGSTKLTLKSRADQHVGRSSRTGKLFAHPSFSHIREHNYNSCFKNIQYKDFKILDQCQTEHDLRILESLYIKSLEPSLNDRQSATPLLVS